MYIGYVIIVQHHILQYGFLLEMMKILFKYLIMMNYCCVTNFLINVYAGDSNKDQCAYTSSCHHVIY